MHLRWPLLLILLAGCVRDFGRPPPPVPDAGPPPVILQPLGTGCGDAGACASGACVDGLCCEAACLPSQACNDPRSPGHCTDHPLGTACAAGAACPTGACVDGVCCETTCGPCQRCDLPGSVGSCATAPEGTDLHQDCGPCQACFGGLCTPAEPGSDPHRECGAGRCGALGRCGAVDGGSCAADADCALGLCLAGACVQVEVEQLEGLELNPFATERSLVSVAANPLGDVALTFQERQTDSSGSPLEDDTFLAVRPAQGGWRLADLVSTGVGAPSSAFFLGHTAYGFVDQVPPGASCAATPSPGCGLNATPLLPSGQPGQPERVDDPSQGFTQYLNLFDTLTDPHGGVVGMIYGYAGGGQVRTYLRADGGWADAGTTGDLTGVDNDSNPRLGLLGDQARLVYFTFDAAVTVSNLAGQVEAASGAGDGGNPCDSPYALRVNHSPTGPALEFVEQCMDWSSGTYQPYLGRYQPGAQPAFSYRPLPGAPRLGMPAGGFVALSWPDRVGVAWPAPDGGWGQVDALRLAHWQRLSSLLVAAGKDGLPFLAVDVALASDPAVTPIAIYTIRFHR